MSQFQRCCCTCQTFTVADYINQTLVPTYLTSGESTIPPYPRPSNSISGDPDPNCPGGPGTDNPACGPWPVTEIPFSAGAYILHDGNLFSLSGDPIMTQSICPGPGMKIVQAQKQFHGRRAFGFCPDGCTAVATKYLTSDRHATLAFDQTIYDEDGTTVISTNHQDFEIRRKATVNRYSGLDSKVECVPYSTDHSPDFWQDIMFQMFSWEYADPGDGCVISLPFTTSSPLQSWPDWDAFDADPAWHYEEHDVDYDRVFATEFTARSGTQIIGTVTFSQQTYRVVDDGMGGFTRGTLSQDIQYVVDFTVELSDAYAATDVQSDATTAGANWVLKNHHLLPFRTDTWRTVGVRCEYKELTETGPDDFAFQTTCTLDDYRSPTAGSGTEGDPYTAWQQMDWVDMRGYIWITGDHITNPALEAADELRLVYDGSVIGKPFTPDAGTGQPEGLPDKNFGFGHTTWGCYYAPDLPPQTEARFYGAYAGENSTGMDATDAVIPKSASLWTEQLTASFYFPGSWSRWFTDSVFVIQKQIESAKKFDALNFFVGGFFRHDMDYNVATKVTGVSGDPDDPQPGDTIYFADDDLTDTGRAAGYITTADKVVWGKAGDYRIFAIVSLAAGSAVLGAQDTNRRHVADAYKLWDSGMPGGLPVPTGFYGFIGKLRVWKRETVVFDPPAIMGKVQITSVAQDGADVVITVSTKYTQIDDKVDFVQGDAADTVNNDNSGAGWPLTAASDTELRFTGTYDPLTMKGYLKIHGADLAKYNSTKSRRDFFWFIATNDPATGDFGTVSFSDDRYTKVNGSIGCTPNGDLAANESKTENYPAGTGYPFPTDAIASTCGSKSCVLPYQCMQHPLVGVPFCIDSGGSECVGFSVIMPYVEAFSNTRLAEYEGAGYPKLPDGFALYLPSIGPVEVGATCDAPNYLPNGAFSPWALTASVWTPPTT